MGQLGAHVSVSGGVDQAVERAVGLGCEAFQIFVKSPNRWQSKTRSDEETARFQSARQAADLPVVAHAGYLINLASPDETTRERSIAALEDELRRCEALGVSGLVLHPGAPKDDGREVGIERVARGLDTVLEATDAMAVKVLLENTAGQGSTLGVSMTELAAIDGRMERRDRIGVCLDTCHAFAAGYDLRQESEYERLLGELDDGIGLNRLRAWHLNDSKFPAGKRRDRHENIGEGEIGLEPFARIVNDVRFDAIPMALETPLGDDDQGHARDLATLKGLR